MTAPVPEQPSTDNPGVSDPDDPDPLVPSGDPDPEPGKS